MKKKNIIQKEKFINQINTIIENKQLIYLKNSKTEKEIRIDEDLIRRNLNREKRMSVQESGMLYIAPLDQNQSIPDPELQKSIYLDLFNSKKEINEEEVLSQLYKQALNQYF